jgi:hypothetical protein
MIFLVVKVAPLVDNKITGGANYMARQFKNRMEIFN